MKRGTCLTCSTPITLISDRGGARWIHDGDHDVTVTVERSWGPVTFVRPCDSIRPADVLPV